MVRTLKTFLKAQCGWFGDKLHIKYIKSYPSTHLYWKISRHENGIEFEKRIAADSLLPFFGSSKLPQAFSQMYHDGELDTQEATRLLCSVWVEIRYLKHKKIQKDPRKISPLDISGSCLDHIWIWKTSGNISESVRFEHPPNWCKNSTGSFHTSRWTGLLIVQRYVSFKKASGHSRRCLSNLSGHLLPGHREKRTGKSIRGPWAAICRHGRPKVYPNHPKPQGPETAALAVSRKLVQGFSLLLSASRSSSEHLHRLFTDSSHALFAKAKQLGIDDVDIDDLGGQGQMCPRAAKSFQKLPKARNAKKCQEISESNANSVILRISFCSWSPLRWDVRMSENEAFLVQHSSLAQEYNEGTTAQPNKPCQPHQSWAIAAIEMPQNYYLSIP